MGNKNGKKYNCKGISNNKLVRWHGHECESLKEKLNPQRLGKGAGRVRNRRPKRDYLDYNTVKIRENTEKSPGLMWKTRKE